MEEVGFHSAFTFKYSERKHTIAARRYRDDVPDEIKADRVTRLVDLQKATSLRKNGERIGEVVAVLVEGDAKKSSSQWMGRTDTNVTTVWEKHRSASVPGDMVLVRVSRASATTLFGEEVSPP